jgi:hypothetical protein
MTYRGINRSRPSRIITNDDEEKIVSLYKEGKSGAQILEALGFKVKTTKTIYDVLRKWGINRKSGIQDYNPIQADYFSRIDTKTKAYLLGFMIADGWIHLPRQIGFTLAEEDRWVIELLKSETRTASNIVVRPPRKFINPQGRECISSTHYQLIMSSRKLLTDLVSHGVYSQKSLREVMPVVCQSLQSHVIRGIFDGDGTIYEHSGGNHLGVRFVGGPYIVAQVGLYLHLRIGASYQYPKKKSADSDLCYVEWTRYGDISPILSYLYKDSADLRLERKYEKAKSYLS